jgi:hypothetical protein
LALAALAGNVLATRAGFAFLAGFFRDRTEAVFARWVRMLFAMKRIY